MKAYGIDITTVMITTLIVRGICANTCYENEEHVILVCPFSFYPRSRERGRLNIFLGRIKPRKKKERKEKGD